MLGLLLMLMLFTSASLKAFCPGLWVSCSIPKVYYIRDLLVTFKTEPPRTCLFAHLIDNQISFFKKKNYVRLEICPSARNIRKSLFLNNRKRFLFSYLSYYQLCSFRVEIPWAQGEAGFLLRKSYFCEGEGRLSENSSTTEPSVSMSVLLKMVRDHPHLSTITPSWTTFFTLYHFGVRQISEVMTMREVFL